MFRGLVNVLPSWGDLFFSFFSWLECGSPQKLDNLNRCKMACKLKQKGPFYEKVLRQQIQESRSA